MRTWQMGAHYDTQLCSIFPQPLPQHRQWLLVPVTPTFPSPIQSPKAETFSYSRILCSAKYRRLDPNAETQRFSFKFRGEGDEDDDEVEDEVAGGASGKKRRWWSDELPRIDEGVGGILDEAIDRVWILKVFRSYGWTLPFIIVSLLLATGPKAFLMALALPLGQSAISLALEKLWGGADVKPKRKSRKRRKPSARTVSGVTMEEEEDDETEKTRKGKTGYQSWAVGDVSTAGRSNQDAANFGGWGELDTLRSAERAERSSRRRDGQQRMPMGKGNKLNRRQRRGGTPLLLRLLIAIFPFLDSWTKML
ncbi:Transmembrane protein [Quillaja saponaria]|uniref:Transmembrane protein n=1 Tax=Quillaja saponaria TaxID=32244 RepID=A0AAD7QEA6_QUISA|nr:Transmembrane protein [Quillaja saponaria]